MPTLIVVLVVLAPMLVLLLGWLRRDRRRLRPGLSDDSGLTPVTWDHDPPGSQTTAQDSPAAPESGSSSGGGASGGGDGGDGGGGGGD